MRKRRDQYGTKIVKGKKNHKISFLDEAYNIKIAEVHIVESYKEFYSREKHYDQKNCTCNIFWNLTHLE